ncbi:MAG: hypothetical protein HC905_19490 [Bacteroidales bacterium]|nr:hypothetical protein [Bacteroidales bacterium]
MGKIFNLWVGIIFFISICSRTTGQEFIPTFRQYSNAEGLSQSVVISVFQDSKNFLWLGTEDGLNKFDGYNFKIYRYDPADSSSISDNWIERIYIEDKDNDLWIVTGDRNINIFSPKYEQFRHIIPEEKGKNKLSPFNGFFL